MRSYLWMSAIVGLVVQAAVSARADSYDDCVSCQSPWATTQDDRQTDEACKVMLSNYEQFLRANKKIRDVIDIDELCADDGLKEALTSLDSTGRLPPFADGQDVKKKQVRRKLYLRRIALALWLGVNKKLPWSLTSYSKKELKQLLGYKEQFGNSETTRMFLRLSADLDEVFASQKWLRQTPQDTIHALGDWVRQHVSHRVGDTEPRSMHEALKGGDYGSCHNTGDFMAVAALALNIPVTQRMTVDKEISHWNIDFPAAKLALPHNDDLYSLGRVAPVSEVFYSGEERTRYFHNLKHDHRQAMKDSWLRPLPIQARYPRPPLLQAACGGPAAVATHFYKQYDCIGKCRKLADYSRDVERIVVELYPALKAKADAAGVCARDIREKQP